MKIDYPDQNIKGNVVVSFVSSLDAHFGKCVNLVTFDLDSWPGVKPSFLQSSLSGAKGRVESRGAICFGMGTMVKNLFNGLNFDLWFWPEVNVGSILNYAINHLQLSSFRMIYCTWLYVERFSSLPYTTNKKLRRLLYRQVGRRPTDGRPTCPFPQHCLWNFYILD